jgi:hypothetical protein
MAHGVATRARTQLAAWIDEQLWLLRAMKRFADLKEQLEGWDVRIVLPGLILMHLDDPRYGDEYLHLRRYDQPTFERRIARLRRRMGYYGYLAYWDPEQFRIVAELAASPT